MFGSKAKEPNNTKNDFLASFLCLLKNSVFHEDKECHFPHIIPLLPQGFEKPFSNSKFYVLCPLVCHIVFLKNMI
jgi:hypothetical protein